MLSCVFPSSASLWYFFPLFIFLPIDLLYYLIIPPLGNVFGQRPNIYKCPLFKKARMLPRNPHHALSQTSSFIFWANGKQFPLVLRGGRGVGREEKGSIWSPEMSSVEWLDSVQDGTVGPGRGREWKLGSEIQCLKRYQKIQHNLYGVLLKKGSDPVKHQEVLTLKDTVFGLR